MVFSGTDNTTQNEPPSTLIQDLLSEPEHNFLRKNNKQRVDHLVTICYMNAFAAAVSKRGLPRKLYVDNGSAFRSRQLEYTTAALGIALIHAKPYQPQGRGKIERFFKTVRTQFLPSFTGTTLEEINAAFDLWLRIITRLFP